MLDWIFEGIIDWVAGIASSIMDAISGLPERPRHGHDRDGGVFPLRLSGL